MLKEEPSSNIYMLFSKLAESRIYTYTTYPDILKFYPPRGKEKIMKDIEQFRIFLDNPDTKTVLELCEQQEPNTHELELAIRKLIFAKDQDSALVREGLRNAVGNITTYSYKYKKSQHIIRSVFKKLCDEIEGQLKI
jgi:hypothetical protein